MSNDTTAKRVARLIAGVLLPCIIAVFLYVLLGAITETEPSILLLLPFFLISAYFTVGLQSIIYSITMEFCVWRIVGINYWAILVSALLGAICGLSVLFTMKEKLIDFLLLGLISGLISGLVLYILRKDWRMGLKSESKVGKNRIRICLSMFVPIIIICLLLFLLARQPDSVRELRREDISPMLKRITGKELPDKVKDLRAIVFSEGDFEKIEQLFVAFQTDQENCSRILDEFGGQDVNERHEFPQDENNPFSWDMYSFEQGYHFQQKLGVDLFDIDLINRIRDDALEHANTFSYPKDAVTGYYLEFNASSKLLYHRVLVFKDRGIVYITASKVPKGYNNGR